MQNKTYTKDNSFVGLSGLSADQTSVLSRINQFSGQIDSLDESDVRKKVLRTACQDLLKNGTIKDKHSFWLRPHIVEELNRTQDKELSRYLFYRYRYDMNPLNKTVDAYPPCVQIEPTSVCNYRCVFCYQTDPKLQDRKAGHKGRMDLDLYKTIIDQIHGHVEAVTLASRGEPLLCKDIVKMLEYTAGKFMGLKINTNAWYLDEEKIHALLAAEPNTLVFSADAADAKLYEELRVNGRLDKVLANIKKFAEIKAKHYPNSRTITRVSGVKFSDQQNFAEIEKFWNDYVDQVAFVEYNPWESVYDAEASHVDTPCSDLWRRLFIWWDGRVNPCDVDYLSSLAVGNIKEKSLTDLWMNEGYAELRKKHLEKKREELMPCKNCVLI